MQKNQFQWFSCQAFVLALVLALSFGVAFARGDPDPSPQTVRAGRRTYGVLDTSPDGRYALVWGLKSRQINFDRLLSDETYGENVLSYDYRDRDVLNSIIDCKKHIVITTIPEFHHVPRLNHSDISALWGTHDGYCVVFWDSKWSPEGFCLIGLSGANIGRRTQFLPSFRRCVEGYFHAATLQPREMLGGALEFKPTLDSSNHLNVATSAYVAKGLVGWAFDSTLTYALTKDGRFIRRVPFPDGSTWAYETPWDDDDAAKRAGKVIVAGFKGSVLSWRSDVVSQVTREAIQRVKRMLPKSFLNQIPPAVEISQAESSFPDPIPLPLSPVRHSQLAVRVTINPDPDDATWSYEAVFVYEVSVHHSNGTLKRYKVESEQTTKFAQKTGHLGIPDS